MKHRLLTVVILGLILLMIPFIAFAGDYTNSCGANLIWTLNNEGVLTISGTGAMYNYQTNGHYSPSWLGSSQSSNYPKVKTVIILDGVTTIGDHAFDNVSSDSITSISFPTSITSIGMYAFLGFSNQCTINYGGTVDQWNALVNTNNTKANNPGLFYSNVSIIYTCAEHTAGNPEYEKMIPATCSSSGSYQEVVHCSACGAEMSRIPHIIPALGHDYSWSVTTEPTCTETGTETGTCSHCNETDTRTVAALGHDFGDWIQTTAPTCEEDGEETRYCSRCNATETQSVNALGHDIQHHNPQDPTCVDIGWDAYNTCSRCDYSTYVKKDELGHSYGEWRVTSDPTCTAGGVKIQTCTRCDSILTELIPALSHTLERHDAFAATCTTAGNSTYWNCDRCQKFFSDEEGNTEIQENSWVINALGHHMTSHAAVEATCTTAGISTYWYCNRCQKHFSDENGENAIAENSWVINALGHNLAHHAAVAATCTTAGNSAYWDCDRCQKFFSDEEGKTEIQENSWVINALGHIEVTDVAVAATCTETGLTEGKHCSRCNLVLTAQTTVTALGHDFGDWIQTAAPTCEGDGNETRYCSRCNAAETHQVNALGHTLEHHDAVAATCTTAGNSTYWDCSRCQKFFSDEEGKTEIQKNSWVINALGHNMTPHTAVAATCITVGNSAYWDCSRCQKFFSNEDGKTEIQVNSWVINALGHSMTTHTAIAPTCKTTGNSAYWNCSQCQKFFSDEEGKTEIQENSWVINALGHNMAHHAAVAATCTTAGNSAYWDCSRCQKFFSDEQGKTEIQENSWVINALGHIEVTDAAVSATCTESGLTEGKHCSHCNLVLTAQTTVDPLGHDFGNWIQTTAPTCEGNGNETRYCSRCDAAETHKVNALGHTLEHHDAVAATCTTAGNSTYWDCSRCQKFFSDEEGKTEVQKNSWVIDALEHCMTPHGAVAATCTTAGNSAYWDCSRCQKFFSDENGSNEIAENSWVISALGHNITPHAAVAATCTTAGNSAYWDCSRCQKFFSDEEGNTETQENSWMISVIGHNMTPHAAVEATCTTVGNSAYWNCSRCQKFFSDEEGNAEIQENSWMFDALGHNMTPHAAVEATCTTEGNSAYWDCSRCQKFFSDEEGKTEIQENSWVISALGHNMTPHTTVKATCTTTGNSAYWNCSRCQKYFSDKDGKNQIEKDSWVIDPLGHIEVADAAVSATCTETGLTEGKHCSRCNLVLTAQTIVDALGHDYGIWIQTTAPTCEGNGEATRYCSRCDATETQRINALGHSFGEWHVTTDPSCAIGGVKIQTCTRCDVIKTESIPALGHTLEHHDAVTATCTENGNFEYWSCTRCEKNYSDEHSENELSAEQIIIQAYGHSSSAPVEENVVPATCTEAGSHDLVTYCSVCHTETNRKTEPLSLLGHLYDDPVFTWDDNGSKCTATQICINNPEHVKSFSTETTSLLVQPPTDTENGIIRYTAVFSDTSFGTQETTLAIPTLKDMNVIVLPEKLLFIDEYAFSGIKAEAIIIPEGCLEIGANAFADCENLRYVRIPKSVTKIAENAFDGCRRVVLDIRQH